MAKPEYIGLGNFDTNNYVYAYCKCPLPVDYAIKWPRIKDGKIHHYTCICEDCGTEVGVISKSYGPELLDRIEKEEEIGQWIPVSERLPEDGERVLVTYDKIVIRATWDLMRYRFYDTHAASLDTDFVYAWMPLPKPYTGEARD